MVHGKISLLMLNRDFLSNYFDFSTNGGGGVESEVYRRTEDRGSVIDSKENVDTQKKEL